MLDQRCKDGSSYNKISQKSILSKTHSCISSSKINKDKTLRLKINAHVDFNEDKLDLELLKRPKMRNRKQEKERLLGKSVH